MPRFVDVWKIALKFLFSPDVFGFAEFEIHRLKAAREEAQQLDETCAGCEEMRKCIETCPEPRILKH